MMDNDSYNGGYKKDPFNFKHFSLTQIGISVNTEEVPFKQVKLNFDDKLIVTAYNTLFSGTGKLHGSGNSGSVIKREDYSEEYTIIVADLTSFEINDNFDLKAEGTLSIDFVFKVLSQLLSTYWFMQNTTTSLKLIATVTQSKIGATSDEHLKSSVSPSP